MPHVTGHSPHGGSTPGPVGMGSAPPKKKTNPYKQAAQSMMSAGISSVSGSTTSDKKGNEAKKRQEDYRDRNRNNNVDPIVPKPKPEPDEKKEELRLDIPGSDPYKDDRPTTGVTTGANKAKDEGSNIFGNLQYNMDLSQPVTSLMGNADNELNSLDSMVLQNPEDASDTKIVNVENAQTSDVLEAINLMADATTKIVLNNEEFQIKAENLVDEIVPPEYKDTLGASIILAEAVITGDYEVKRKLTDNLQIKASTKRYGKNMSIFLTGKF